MHHTLWFFLSLLALRWFNESFRKPPWNKWPKQTQNMGCSRKRVFETRNHPGHGCLKLIFERCASPPGRNHGLWGRWLATLSAHGENPIWRIPGRPSNWDGRSRTVTMWHHTCRPCLCGLVGSGSIAFVETLGWRRVLVLVRAGVHHYYRSSSGRAVKCGGSFSFFFSLSLFFSYFASSALDDRAGVPSNASSSQSLELCS